MEKRSGLAELLAHAAAFPKVDKSYLALFFKNKKKRLGTDKVDKVNVRNTMQCPPRYRKQLHAKQHPEIIEVAFVSN